MKRNIASAMHSFFIRCRLAQRVVLADKQMMFRTGVARVLSREPGLEVVAQCEDSETLDEILSFFQNVTVILPTSLAKNMLEIVTSINSKGSRVVLIVEEDVELEESLRSYAHGVVSRSISGTSLVETLHRIAAGERVVQQEDTRLETPEDLSGRAALKRLTPKEVQIVALVAEGWKNRQIATELNTKEQVVKNYLRGIYDKTGTADRLELALLTIHHRTLHQPQILAQGK